MNSSTVPRASRPKRPSRAVDTLKPFQLEGVQDTGIQVSGDGSYVTVKELNFRGLKCLGKKIHTLAYEMANLQERSKILGQWMDQCKQVSELHHPCIAQFMGVHFESGSQIPMLVMEYLYITLAESLEKHGVLPEEVTYGILQNVAQGLRYLHERISPIIHGHLSAYTILLNTNMSAKISDLGMAKLLNLSLTNDIGLHTSSQAQGIHCYMPPEAIVSEPSYNTKVDSYSFGILVIHVLCGRWPYPAEKFTEALNSPGTFIHVSEFDRRTEYILMIGLEHPLMPLIRQCLSNSPRSRPEASRILDQIEDVLSSFPSPFGNKVEMIQQIQSQDKETAGGIERLQKENELLARRNQELHERLTEVEARRETQRSEFKPEERKSADTCTNCPPSRSLASANCHGEDGGDNTLSNGSYGEDSRPGSPLSEQIHPAQPDEEEPMVPGEPGHQQTTKHIGDPTLLTVKQGDEQEGVQPKAAAVGEKTGLAEIKVSENPDRTFDILFNPSEPDRYIVVAQLNGKCVPGTPFTVNYIRPIDPSKCHILGLEGIPSVPQVNKPILFGVDATKGGNAKLSVTADGPSAEGEDSKLEVKTREDNPQVYDISYAPSAAGLHRIHLVWAKEEILGSPLHFFVGDASAVPTYPHGEPIAMDVNNLNCNPGELEVYASHEDTGSQFKVKISKGSEKRKFTFSFQPIEPGIYAVHVLLKGKEIVGSPYHVKYAKPADASAVVVSGLDDHCYVGQPLVFQVDLTEAGRGDMLVRGSGPTEGINADFEDIDNHDGTYSAIYTPHTAGDHYIDITWGGQRIPKSPFHIRVTSRPLEIKTVLMGNNTTNIIPVGQKIKIRLNTLSSGARGEDYLEVQCTGKNSGEAATAIEQGSGHSFLICFTPTIIDDYRLSMKLDETDLVNGTVLIKAVDKQSLSGISHHPPGTSLSDIQVGAPVNLIVPFAVSGRKEEVEFKVQGPDGACDVEINDSLEGALGIAFTPPTPGDYVISATKDGRHIGYSPYKIRTHTLSQLPDVSKVSIIDEDLGIFQKSIHIGKPAQFHISTKDAGSGSLHIFSRGPGEAEVETNNAAEDGLYTCEFLPAVPGDYHIDILWNNEPIPGSPFMLNFKAPSIVGLNIQGHSFRIGVPHRFTVHCEKIGDGILEAACKPPTAAKVHLVPIEGKNSYRCEVFPVEVGNHEMCIQYNGKHILGSPFNVQFGLRGDASKVRMVEGAPDYQHTEGDTVIFFLSTEGAGKGILTSSAVNAVTKKTQEVSVTQVAGDCYMVEFTPRDGTQFLLTIMYDYQHILGSPFNLVLGPPPKDVRKCSAVGDGIVSAQVEKWSKFVVNCENAGAGDLQVDIEHVEGGGERLLPVITAMRENVYAVSYLPMKSGFYHVVVRWAGIDIPNSPFTVRCYHPADPSLFSVLSPVNELLLGDTLRLEVKSSCKSEGELTCYLQSNRKEAFPVDVRQESQEKYVCSIDPPTIGKYIVHIQWNGENIQGSPFKVIVMSPPRPDRVRAYGPGLEDGIVGQAGHFTVETSEGGSGTLAVRVNGPKGAFKIRLSRHPDSNRTILARYDPTHVGKYTVEVSWSEVHIPGSPFRVNIRENGTK